MLHKRLPLLTALVIGLASIGLSAYQLYPIYLEISGSDGDHSMPASRDRDTSAPAPANNESITSVKRNISEFSMFGNYNSVAVQEPDIQELPKTNLRLTLTGVSATDDQKNATALIEGPDRTTENYRVGATLPGSAELHSVHKDRVILSRSGKLETLFFTDSDSSTRLISSVTNANDTNATPSANTNYQTQDPDSNPRVIIPEGAPKMTSEQKQSIRDKLSALRSRLRKQ